MSRRRKAWGEAAFRHYVSKTKDTAKRKGLIYTLDNEEVRWIINQDCSYCGCPPVYYIELPCYYGGFYKSGMDRFYNEVGYKWGNVVPCCTRCNYLKGKRDGDVFLNWLELERAAGNFFNHN